jgi:hypothetical protein
MTIERLEGGGHPRSADHMPGYCSRHDHDRKYVADDRDMTADGLNARTGRSPSAAYSMLTGGSYEQCWI